MAVRAHAGAVIRSVTMVVQRGHDYVTADARPQQPRHFRQHGVYVQAAAVLVLQQAVGAALVDDRAE